MGAVLRTVLILVTASCCQADFIEGVSNFDTSLPREPQSLTKWMNARRDVQARLREMEHPNSSWRDQGKDDEPGWRMCHMLAGPCESETLPVTYDDPSIIPTVTSWRCLGEFRHTAANAGANYDPSYKVRFDREKAQQRFGPANIDAPSFDRTTNRPRPTLMQLLEKCANMYIATRTGYKYEDFVSPTPRAPVNPLPRITERGRRTPSFSKLASSIAFRRLLEKEEQVCPSSAWH